MNNMIKENDKKIEDITRKDALKKIGNYGKYVALTALATHIILSPQKSQAASAADAPGTGFDSTF
jgi:hypothetical protein